ncbi:hypothetical protein KM043_002156 [Ampulex compressa]|nr:hypothetical protein KM043_002156 [Ampulex compressa]
MDVMEEGGANETGSSKKAKLSLVIAVYSQKESRYTNNSTLRCPPYNRGFPRISLSKIEVPSEDDQSTGKGVVGFPYELRKKVLDGSRVFYSITARAGHRSYRGDGRRRSAAFWTWPDRGAAEGRSRGGGSPEGEAGRRDAAVGVGSLDLPRSVPGSRLPRRSTSAARRPLVCVPEGTPLEIETRKDAFGGRRVLALERTTSSRVYRDRGSANGGWRPRRRNENARIEFPICDMRLENCRATMVTRVAGFMVDDSKYPHGAGSRKQGRSAVEKWRKRISFILILEREPAVGSLKDGQRKFASEENVTLGRLCVSRDVYWTSRAERTLRTHDRYHRGLWARVHAPAFSSARPEKTGNEMSFRMERARDDRGSQGLKKNWRGMMAPSPWTRARGGPGVRVVAAAGCAGGSSRGLGGGCAAGTTLYVLLSSRSNGIPAGRTADEGPRKAQLGPRTRAEDAERAVLLHEVFNE